MLRIWARALRLVSIGGLVAGIVPTVCWSTDLVFTHGHIYTADPAHPWAEALAVSDGRISAIGGDDAVLQHKTGNAKVVDLQGRTVLPGIIDSHVHLIQGSYALHGVNLSTPAMSITAEHPKELVAAIRAYVSGHPPEKIIFGRADFSTDPRYMPNHKLLDEAVSDRPLILHHTGEHSMWVNSKALELAGISDRPVADPIEEHNVVRDASGRPTGILLESAMELISRAVDQALSMDQKLDMLREATRYLNSLGITSVGNATGNLADIRLYAALRDRGELTLRTRTAFGAVSVPHKLTPQFLKDLEQARTLYHDEWVSANLVKFFADGDGAVPPLVYEPHDYLHLVTELDKRGYQIMTHALRADSAHMVLDTYQAVEKANGARDRRFRIEHADSLDDADIPRFGQLSVIADMQPGFCCTQDQGGPTTDRWQAVRQSAPVLAFSSDWPCTWPPNPFLAMQEAVTRQAWKAGPDNVIPGEVWADVGQSGSLPTLDVYDPEDAVTVQQAVDAYTKGAAFASFEDGWAGTLAVGKVADMIVLSQDVFSVRASQIAATRVLQTIVGGKTVYVAGDVGPQGLTGHGVPDPSASGILAQ